MRPKTLNHGTILEHWHPEGEIIRNALNARHISRPTVPDDNQASA